MADGYTPITGGLSLQPGAGRLNPRRAAELTRSLHTLEAARQAALLTSRRYLISGHKRRSL